MQSRDEKLKLYEAREGAMSINEGVSGAFGVYEKLFRNPAAIVFFVVFLILYSVVAGVLLRPIDLVELVKAVPLAFSALVVGIFSILFWALNYVGRTHKVEMRIRESKELFRVRKELIDEIFEESGVTHSAETSALKAHLILNCGEIHADPTAPGTNLFEYSDIVQAILRRS